MSISEHETASADEAPADEGGPRGLGGWLIIPLIGLVVTALIIASKLYSDVGSVAYLLTLMRRGFRLLDVQWAPAVVSIACELGLLVLAIVLMVQAYRRKRAFVWNFVTYLALLPVWSLLAATVLGAGGAALGPADLRMFIRDAAGSLIWIAYMLQSRRVRNTFVED